MKIKKKLLALLMTLIMAISAVNVNAEIITLKLNFYVWVTVDSLGETNTDGKAVSIGKTAYKVSANTTASDVFKMVLEENEVDYTCTNSEWGEYWASIGGLGYNEETGKYWEFVVNGQSASVGAGEYRVHEGDRIEFLYRAGGETTVPEYEADDVRKNPTKESYSTYKKNAYEQASILAKHIYDTTFESGKVIPGIESSSALRTVAVLKQSGLKADDFYKKVADKVISQVAQMKNGGEVKDVSVSYYDYENNTSASLPLSFANLRAINAECKSIACTVELLSYLGYDCTNIKGVNLIKEMTSKEAYDTSEYSYGAYGRDGYILKALDAGNYKLNEDNNNKDAVTRKKLIKKITSDFGYAYDVAKEWDCVDSIAMDVEAVAPYLSDEYAKAHGVTDNNDEELFALPYLMSDTPFALRMISEFQKNDGSYESFGAKSYNSLAVAMIAYAKAGVNLASESQGYDVIKNGVTMFDVASQYVDVKNKKVDPSVSYGADQLLEALYLAANVLPENETPKKVIATNTAVNKVKKAKVSIKKATKKKSKLTIVLKNKVSKATGYSARVFKSKKDANKNKSSKALLKKTITKNKKTLTINIKKLKNKKKVYVRVRAYIKYKGKKYYSNKWSKVILAK
ncbi:MAG: DUF4430 domain-containing protein [Lachnospiraceae bacterium]|nr:DUF4430 domain-containing protein [Lachnospiraceae bacterium]